METIYFRADMNSEIGTGHIMRCMAIADEIMNRGGNVSFILADNQAAELLEGKKIPYFILNTDWNNMEEELGKLEVLIRVQNIRYLIIDSYKVTYLYLKNLYNKTYTIYLDDLNSFIYPVHEIICYANYWMKYNYRNNYILAKQEGTIEKVPIFYLGTTYVPLRKEFQNVSKKKINESIDNIVILSGGTDSFGVLAKLLSYIDVKKYKQVNVIYGRYSKEQEHIRRQYEQYPQVHILGHVDNIIEYMKQADVVISAGGITLYELCAVGTPTITYTFADNQLNNVLQFEEDGIMEYIGDFRQINVKKNLMRVLNKISNPDYRKAVSIKAQRLVDGKGAVRLAKVLDRDN